MSILMPVSPAPQQAKPRLIDWSRILTPQAGGDLQQLNRLGTRFAMDITMPRRTGDGARVFLSKLLQAKAAGIIIGFPQIGIEIGTPGSPVVDGGASGMTLPLRGLTAGYTVLDGQFLSLIHAGRRYVHHATADTSADGTGKMALPVFPMLRITATDGEIVEFDPKIEGLLSGNEQSWTLARYGTDGIEFSVTEMS